MIFLKPNWIFLSREEMLEKQELLPINHSWKKSVFKNDYYIIPSVFDEDAIHNNILTFNVPKFHSKELEEQAALMTAVLKLEDLELWPESKEE